MSFSKTFKVFDLEYEVFTSDFSPGSPGSYWDPPDGPEWDGENIVEVTYPGGLEDYVTWETFVTHYAMYHLLTYDQAVDKITDAMCEYGLEYYAERWDE